MAGGFADLFVGIQISGRPVDPALRERRNRRYRVATMARSILSSPYILAHTLRRKNGLPEPRAVVQCALNLVKEVDAAVAHADIEL